MSQAEKPKRWKLKISDILISILGLSVSLAALRLSMVLIGDPMTNPSGHQQIGWVIVLWYGGLFVFGGTFGAIIRRLMYGTEVDLARGFWMGGFLGIPILWMLGAILVVLRLTSTA